MGGRRVEGEGEGHWEGEGWEGEGEGRWEGEGWEGEEEGRWEGEGWEGEEEGRWEGEGWGGEEEGRWEGEGWERRAGEKGKVGGGRAVCNTKCKERGRQKGGLTSTAHLANLSGRASPKNTMSTQNKATSDVNTK